MDGEVRLTWLELRSAALDAARALVGMGVRPGDRVALCAPNSAQWVVAALGALRAGAALVPINTRFTATETLDVVQRSAARVLIVEGEFLGRDREAELRALSSELPSVVRLPAEWVAADVDLPELTEDQLCDVMFTSGTTGRSKGAMSAHRQSLGVAEAWAACGELTSADRYLIVNPFFHTFGYKAGILACVLTGATIVPQPVFDVAETMRLIERERITVLPGPPTIFQALLDHPERGSFDLSSLRLVVTGAAVVPVVLIERLRAELSLTVLTAYGLTEAVVATMCRPGDSPETVAHTCGVPMAGFELQLGERDEVLLRGPNVMLGYLDDPDATAEAVDADGWLHTGDVGALDERGYLSITDRLKDMYICGGFNVYPAEVEQALARLPGVAESAVVGMADSRLGEVGVAHIVTAPGFALTSDEVIAFCRERLANYKVPRAVEFHPALPRNAMGKVLKIQLRKENA
ncbi:Acyl-CoA synthetase (AMP-forming)/AMP-acid ligase II [Lentzea albidocapillata subsp. violacea]|uniref:Acyl-CoA synthetase (AMP-forming)/AMP-acid ligase II n=1 Tax=Lentzea albidocapillata subsp. violacea TaxID=128104 RepID=A0A1G8R383_9PSEU|nr:Acyl-CoA synthetase (AMP-forming)/AMP-acid ligase II [Lentzea albidocapillata subsp. violacea]